MFCSHMISPRSRRWAFLGLWCTLLGAEEGFTRPQHTGYNFLLIREREGGFGAFGRVWDAST